MLLGFVQIDEWLKSKKLPRLPLPEICGYIPTIRYIAHAVVDNKMTEMRSLDVVEEKEKSSELVY